MEISLENLYVDAGAYRVKQAFEPFFKPPHSKRQKEAMLAGIERKTTIRQT